MTKHSLDLVTKQIILGFNPFLVDTFDQAIFSCSVVVVVVRLKIGTFLVREEDVVDSTRVLVVVD